MSEHFGPISNRLRGERRNQENPVPDISSVASAKLLQSANDARYAAMAVMSSIVSFSTTGFIKLLFEPRRMPVLNS
jgi:hypothetical protein